MASGMSTAIGETDFTGVKAEDWQIADLDAGIRALQRVRQTVTQTAGVTLAERRERGADLRREGLSLRAIAGRLGISYEQVRRDLSQVTDEEAGSLETVTSRTGADGRTTKPNPARKPSEPIRHPKRETPDEHAQVIELARRQLTDLREQYAIVTYLSPVWAAIDELNKGTK